jgi:hypothetical protein
MFLFNELFYNTMIPIYRDVERIQRFDIMIFVLIIIDKIKSKTFNIF